MKKILSIFLLLGVVGSLQAKTMHKVFGLDDRTIKNSCKVHLYMVDAIPVMSIEQKQGENYIYDYRIINLITVNKKVGSLVSKAALDTTQYLYGLERKCPFMAKYAVHFKAGKRTVTIIVSPAPCGKAIIFCPGSVVDKKHIDLVENSQLISAVESLFMPKLESK